MINPKKIKRGKQRFSISMEVLSQWTSYSAGYLAVLFSKKKWTIKNKEHVGEFLKEYLVKSKKSNKKGCN